MNHGWNGVLIEGNVVKYQELAKNFEKHTNVYTINTIVGFTSDNDIDSVLSQTPIPSDFGLISIDIDGCDYYIWDSIKIYKPKVVIIEYNTTVPNDIVFVQSKDMSVSQGCSLLALIELGKQKGYELIAVTSCNGIFVLSEEYNKFNIPDNKINNMKPDSGKRIWQGFDGTIFTHNFDTLLWRGRKIDREDLQVLPKKDRFLSDKLSLKYSQVQSENKSKKILGKNIALNKPAQQSSISRYSQPNDSQGAVNGIKNGGFGFCTDKEVNPWWQVDLEQVYSITEIQVYNRINSLLVANRARTLTILLSSDGENWELVYANEKDYVFGGIDGNPLIVDLKDKLARFVKLQLQENEYFHLDEVEIYGVSCEPVPLLLEFTKNEATLPPKEIPTEYKVHFTLGNRIPVIYTYFNDTRSSSLHIRLQAYYDAFEKLENGSFKYYGKTLDHLLNSLDKYSIFGKTVLIFGLAGINCDAISLWKGAKDVYVIDYNLPVSEHPQVHILSYEDYIKHNIQTDVAISISSFEHDGLGRYGDPINPNGDLEAMKLAKQLIKKDGLLFFSVPIGQDCIVWNAHRIYGKIRLPMMLEGWKIVDSFGFSEALMINQDLGRFEQPIFVLKNL